jgi:hypothetical protein
MMILVLDTSDSNSGWAWLRRTVQVSVRYSTIASQFIQSEAKDRNPFIACATMKQMKKSL